MKIIEGKNFKETLEKIKKEGKEKLHILVDFDKTLTKFKVDNKKIPSVISLLRDGDYISPEYAAKAHELYAKYHPIEIDANATTEEKKKAMSSWWTEHFNLLIKSHLNKKHLEQISNSSKIKFRKGVLEFLDHLNENKIPLIIISSSGLGDTIPMLLQKENKLYVNINIITNKYIWDEKGFAKGVKKTIIHSMNKDETILKKIPKIYEKIKDKKNVILLGDSLGDTEMITGFDYNHLLKIGFLNENIEELKEKYKKNFDLVIMNDGDFSKVNEVIKQIK